MTPQEVNEYLARKLMGYKGNRTWERWNPYYDITQALGNGGEGTVVEAMRKKGWWLDLETADLNEDRHFANFRKSGEKPGVGLDLLPSAAISVAAVNALKALEGKDA